MKWISVTKKLPRDYERVLVTVIIEGEKYVALCVYDGCSGVFIDLTDGEGDCAECIDHYKYIPGESATHWMSLPDPA